MLWFHIRDGQRWVDCTKHVRIGSLMLSQELNNRTTGSVNLQDLPKKRLPIDLVVGMPVLVSQGFGEGEEAYSVHLFGGQIDKIERVPIEGTDATDLHVKLVDYACVLDRKHYTGVHTEVFPGDILKKIVKKCLESEGFATGYDVLEGEESVWISTVQQGDKPVSVKFSHLSVADCLAEICRRSPYKWWIDANKVIHFKERETELAPWALTTDGAAYSKLRAVRERSQYRNRQFVLGSKVDADSLSVVRWKADKGKREYRLQDGTPYAFRVVLDADGKEVVYGVPPSNGNPATAAYDEIKKISLLELRPTPTEGEWAKEMATAVKEVGNPQEAMWVYEPGGNYIRLIAGQTLPDGIDDIILYYMGRFRILGMAENKEEIASRKAVEGGTGVYEAVEVNEAIDNAGVAIGHAEAVLKLHGKIPTIVEFQTYKPGLRAGQSIEISIPAIPDHKELFLIDSIHMTDIETVDQEHRVRFEVRCVGSEIPKWQDYYRGMMEEEVLPEGDEYGPWYQGIIEIIRVSDECHTAQETYRPYRIASKDGYYQDEMKSWPDTTIIGDDLDSAAKLIELLFETPYPMARVGFSEVSA